MTSYVKEALNNELLQPTYGDDFIQLEDDDQMSEEDLRKLILHGAPDAASEHALEIVNATIARESSGIVSSLAEIWNEDLYGVFDDEKAYDEIATYINDKLFVNVDKLLAENAGPVLVQSTLFDEDDFPHLPPSDAGEMFSKSYADKIVSETGLDTSEKDRVVDMIQSVHGYSYTVAVAGKIDPSILFEEISAVSFNNPTIVIGDFKTGDLQAEDFEGNVVVDRFALEKADIVEDTYGVRLPSDCDVLPV